MDEWVLSDPMLHGQFLRVDDVPTHPPKAKMLQNVSSAYAASPAVTYTLTIRPNISQFSNLTNDTDMELFFSFFHILVQIFIQIQLKKPMS